MIHANPGHLDRHVVARWGVLGEAERNGKKLEVALDEADQGRMCRFRFEEDQARFRLGRFLLAQCLSEYLSWPPGPLNLVLTSEGRPILADRPEIQFSISHSRECVAVALSLHTQVGIDVEYIPPNFNPDELAERIFSESDLKRFQALPRDQSIAAFFQAWTGKEARLKATGEGISGALKEISVPFLTQGAGDVPPTGPWSFQTLPVPPGYMGNLAWNDPQKRPDIRLIDFDAVGLKK